MKNLLSTIKGALIRALYPFFVLLTRHMQRSGLILGAYAVPEGALFQFSVTFAAAKTISALSNASPAAATATAHGYTDDDPILLSSGWEDANESVFEVNQTATDAFEILGLVTTNTNFYPVGSGIGTAEKISSWQTIPQVLTIGSSGGDPRFTTVNPLAKRNGILIPTGFNPVQKTLTMGHDPDNAVYQAMQEISQAGTKVAFRQVLKGGGRTYGYGYLSVGGDPALNNGQVNSVQAVISFLGLSVSYGA